MTGAGVAADLGTARPDGGPAEPLISVEGLTKRFGANRALDDVSIDVRPGEILSLVGHNGSGKSTLVKILAGVYEADSGEVRDLSGDTSLHFIHQDLGLIHELSTVENFWLRPDRGGPAFAPTRGATERARARELLARFGTDLDVDAPLSLATPAQRAIVAIARALDGWQHDRNVLVLDEPTESLHSSEVGILFDSVRTIAASGAGVIYISHRLDEVLELSDRVIVLREGRLVADSPTDELDHSELLRLVTGTTQQHGQQDRSIRHDAPPALEVSGLSGGAVDDVSLSVQPGEVLGIAGVLGSGREDVAPLLFGARPATSETYRVSGTEYRDPSPSRSLRRKVAYIPADRATHGAVGLFSGRENMTLPHLRPLRSRLGTVREGREREETAALVRDYDVRPGTAEQRFNEYSGGNQQKIVFAKWLRNRPDVLLMEEPTQGVDMGAKQSIYATVRRAAAAGSAAVVCSSDAKELAALCDRVVVLRHGRIATELAHDELDETSIIAAGYGFDTPTSPPERAGDRTETQS
ncbi:MAG: sugar ABC transporter ATP-binding protein [Actinomycetaceae bacterium]